MDELWNALRNLLTTAGTAWGVKHAVDGATMSALAGGAVASMSLLWDLYSHRGMKKVPETAIAKDPATGKIIPCVALFAAVALSIGDAKAADLLLTKAPVSSGAFVYPYNGSGIYAGVTAMSDGAVDSAGRGTFGTTGGSYGATVGFQRGNGASWLAVEAFAGYANARGGDTMASTRTAWNFEQRVKLGGNLGSMIGALPNLFPADKPPIPALPSTTGAATIMHPYTFAGLYERKVAASIAGLTAEAWRISPTFGVGVLTQVTGGSVVDLWGEYVAPSQSVSMPNGGVANGPQYRVGMSVLF